MLIFLAAFSNTMRNEVDLEQLKEQLLSVVEETIQPAHVSLWLRTPEKGRKRLWLITTNDNLNALRFYQKRGFRLVAVHRNALEQSRKLKPEIPLIGNHGIPLRDELELEMLLDNL